MATVQGTDQPDVLQGTADPDTIFGFGGMDTIDAGDGDFVDGGAGADRLTLSSTIDNWVTVRDVESILGGSRNDTVTAAAAFSGGTIDLGAGADMVNLGAYHSTTSIKNVETILAGDGSQHITLKAATGGYDHSPASYGSPIPGTAIDLGAGNDVLNIGHFTSVVVAKNVEKITGGLGAGDDLYDQYVIMGSAVHGLKVDLGGDFSNGNTLNGGQDVLDLGDFSSSATVKNVEIILGGAGRQQVTLAAAFTNTNTSHGGYIDLGAGVDRLDLGNIDASRVLAWNVENVFAGSGDQVVRLQNVVHGFVDLGPGSDTLNLGTFNGGDDVRVQNVEFINALPMEEHGLPHMSDQAVKLVGPLLPDVQVDLYDGVDSLDLRAYAGKVEVSRVESIVAGRNDNSFDLGSVGASTGPFDIHYDAAPYVDGGDGFDAVRFSTPATNGLPLTVDDVESVTGGATADHVVVHSAPRGITINLGGGTDIFTFVSGSAVATGAQTDLVVGFEPGSDKIDLSPYGLVLLPEDSPLNGAAPQATTRYDADRDITEIRINHGAGAAGVEERIEVAGAHLTAGDFVL